MLEAIKKGLLSNDNTEFDQAWDRALKLTDGPSIDELTEGTDKALTPPKWMRRSLGLRGLLIGLHAQAPLGSATVARRAQVTSLALSGALDLSPLVHFQNLERLELTNVNGTLPDLDCFPALKILACTSYGSNRLTLGKLDSPRIVELRCMNVAVGTIDLGRLPLLHTLTIYSDGPQVLLVGDRLKTVTLSRSAALVSAPNLESLTATSVDLGEANLPALKFLSVAGTSSIPKTVDHLQSLVLLNVLTDLSELDQVKASRLTRFFLDRAPNVQSLNLKRFPLLETVHVANAPLTRLELPPSVRSVTLLHGAMNNLEGLLAATSLETLSISCDTLTSLKGIEGHPSLKTIQVTQSTKALANVEAAVHLPALQTLHLRGKVGVSRKSIPEALHEKIRPKRLVTKSKAAKPSDKPKPKVVRGTVGTQVSRLKKLLLARDIDKITQAAELAASLGDPAVYEALLGGVTVKRESMEPVAASTLSKRDLIRRRNGPPTPELRKELDTLVPNALFDSGVVVKPYRDHAVRALLSSAGDHFGRDLRDAIEAIEICGSISPAKYRWRTAPVDLSPLLAFTNLKHLSLSYVERVGAIEILPTLQLDSLLLAEIPTTSLAEVKWTRPLKELVIHFLRNPVLPSSAFSVSDVVTVSGSGLSDLNFPGLKKLTLLRGAANLLSSQTVAPEELVIDRVTAKLLQSLPVLSDIQRIVIEHIDYGTSPTRDDLPRWILDRLVT